MKWRHLHIVVGFLLMLPLTSKAQQFAVKDFHKIPNDLTASYTPVYDLNNDACALIKVVCTPDYAFDSPLGIVKRIDEVGEVWLYLPKGSVMLTIRHPQRGVIRDYRFEEELSPLVTYELIIDSPKLIEQDSVVDRQQSLVEPDIENTIIEEPVVENLELLPVHKSTNYMVSGIVGISNETISYGIRVAMFRKHGAWLSFQSDFKSMPTTVGDCDENGKMANSSDAPYYNGEIKRSLLKIMGGGIHRIIGGLHIYEGVGYGNYSVVWGASSGNYYKNTDASAIGVSAEVGVIYRLGSVVFSAGGSTIMAKHWEGNAGIGICF